MNAGVSLFSPFNQYGTLGPGIVPPMFIVGLPSVKPGNTIPDAEVYSYVILNPVKVAKLNHHNLPLYIV